MTQFYIHECIRGHTQEALILRCAAPSHGACYDEAEAEATDGVESLVKGARVCTMIVQHMMNSGIMIQAWATTQLLPSLSASSRF